MNYPAASYGVVHSCLSSIPGDAGVMGAWYVERQRHWVSSLSGFGNIDPFAKAVRDIGFYQAN